MISITCSGFLTPGSSITIWLSPCLRISGSETPSLSTRSRRISTERSRSDCCERPVRRRHRLSATSSPPWRSRPSVGFWWSGEPGIASSATPTSAGGDQRDENEMGSTVHASAGQVSCGLRRLISRGIPLQPGSRSPRPPPARRARRLLAAERPPRPRAARRDLVPGRDLDREVVVLVDLAHVAVEAARGEDLVADRDATRAARAAPGLRRRCGHDQEAARAGRT